LDSALVLRNEGKGFEFLARPSLLSIAPIQNALENPPKKMPPTCHGSGSWGGNGRGTGTARHIVLGQALEKPSARLLPHLAGLGADAAQPDLAGALAGVVPDVDVHAALGAHRLAAVLAQDAVRPQDAEGVAAEATAVGPPLHRMLLDLLDPLHQPTHPLPLGHLDLLVAPDHRDDGLLLLRTQRFTGLRAAPAGL